ncbi:MAG: hypothetical protein WC956_01455 [bacterium]
MLFFSANLRTPIAISGVDAALPSPECLDEPEQGACPAEDAPMCFGEARASRFELSDAPRPNLSQDILVRRGAKDIGAPRTSGVVNAFIASCLLFAAGCGGKMPGDERSMWMPATTIVPQGLSDSIAYAGTNQDLGFGFIPSGYYGNPSDIPSTTSNEQAILYGMLFDELAETTIDFSHPDITRMLSNDVFLTMTDFNAWPNAYYSQGMAEIYGFQVLDANFDTFSDCSNGPCRLQDVVVIKNQNLHPTSRDRSSLTDAEKNELDKMAGWMSEELGHDFIESADATYREGFFQKIKGLWEAGSSGIENDAVFSDAWLKGGIAYAISGSGIKNYSLRAPLQSAIMEIYPNASPSEQYDIEIALISWLQLICNHSSAFIGSPGRSYLDLYKQDDAAAGKSIGTYEQYRDHFIGREGFAHVVTSDSIRQVYPSLLRTTLDGPFLKDFLDQKFNDGFWPDVRIMNNPYLSDFDTLRALVSNVIPLMLAKTAG